MRLTSFAVLLLACGLVITGCSEEAGKDGTSDLSRNMLSERSVTVFRPPSLTHRPSGPGKNPWFR